MRLQFCALGVTMKWLAWERGRPARTKPGTPGPSPPLGSTGNGAMALLRPGRCGSRRQGGCLQHRTEAQRRPKGQDAGGTPALPGQSLPEGESQCRAARRRLMRWGVSGGQLLRKPTCTLWETPVCPRAGRPPCRADHSRKNGRSLMNMNHEWTQTRIQMNLLQPQAAPKCFCNFAPLV